MVTLAGLILSARFALAQTTPPSAGQPWHSFKDIVDSVGKFFGTTVMPILVIIAILAFLYNLIYFMINLNNEKEREVFKKYSVNALIVLTIMLTVWGVVGILTQTFFHTNPFIPQLPTSD